MEKSRVFSSKISPCTCLVRYYHLVIEIEPYYGLSPIWLRVIQRPLENAAKKRLLNETMIYEMYKKYFGRRKATTYKVKIFFSTGSE